MQIQIQIIPMGKMRYNTVGDYYYIGDKLQIDIADTGVPFYNYMVLVHELIELALLERRGVDFEDIDKFDKAFEEEREEGYQVLEAEPGFDPRSPYQREHTLATAVEMLMCAHAGVPWPEYNEAIVTL